METFGEWSLDSVGSLLAGFQISVLEPRQQSLLPCSWGSDQNATSSSLGTDMHVPSHPHAAWPLDH